MKIGVIGLGAMGKAVAGNLLKAGYETVVWNRSSAAVEELVAKGAFGAKSAAEATKCDVLLSLLFDDGAVRDIFLDGDALVSASPGSIHVCMSTISSTVAKELAGAHEKRGLHYVAGPMFGRPDAAAAAKLNIAISGAQEILDRVEPILSLLGKVWRVGDDPLSGHLAKIAGNFMIGCAIEAMAEAAALITSQGGSSAPFLAMMGETLFSSPIYRLYGGAISSGKSPGAPSGLALPLKDVGLALGEASVGGLDLPFAKVMREQMTNAKNHGYGDEDWSTALAKNAGQTSADSMQDKT